MKGPKGVTLKEYFDWEIKEAKTKIKNTPKSLAFPYACVLAGVEETNRQRNKFDRECGIAWAAYVQYH